MLTMAVKPTGISSPKKRKPSRSSRAEVSGLSLKEVQQAKIQEAEENRNKQTRLKRQKRLLWDLEPEDEQYIRRQLRNSRNNYYAEGVPHVLAEFSVETKVSGSVINNIEAGNHQLNKIGDIISILSVLLDAPSGIIPRMPDGRPMHPKNFVEFFTLADPDEVELDSKTGEETTRGKIFAKHGVKYPDKDFLKLYPMNDQDDTSLDDQEEFLDCETPHDEGFDDRKERLVELFRQYGTLQYPKKRGKSNVDYWTELADLIAKESGVDPQIIHDLINGEFDLLCMVWVDSYKLAAILPKEGTGELSWEASEFIEYLTGRYFDPNKAKGKSRTQLTLLDITGDKPVR
jgi:hypothetical protein